MTETPVYLTPPEVAKRLRIRPDKVLAWIRSGELTAIDVSESQGGRPRWRVSEADLQDFLKRRQSQPAPKQTRRRREKPRKSYFDHIPG